MILKFNLNKCIVKYKTGQLQPWAINPDGEKHIDTWTRFAVELLRIRGNTPTRINFSFVDRTGAMPSIVNSYIPDDQLIPSGAPAHANYLDLCLARAQELLDTNKQINVMWSGGLDSTVALFALMRQARSPDQINIVCTFESILESGKMFDLFLKDSGMRIKFEQTRLECSLPYSYDSEDTSQLYVNGQCGDQLFGPKISFPIPGVELNDPWYQGYSRDFLDVLEPSIKQSTRPIETIRDLRWWLFFNHTWTSVLYDDCIERPAHLSKRIHAFYATPEFQRWAQTTPTYYDNTAQYRWPAKQALSQLIDYPYYIEHKTKSLSDTWHPRRDWYMIDKDFKTYYSD